MSTILFMWLCLSNRKGECTCSNCFLLADFPGSACGLQFGVNQLVEAHSSTTKSFNISAMMESKMLHLNLSSMNCPWIRVCPLLFPENTIDKSCTGMWPHAFTFFVWQTKPCDQIIDVCHRRQHYACLWIRGLPVLVVRMFVQEHSVFITEATSESHVTCKLCNHLCSALLEMSSKVFPLDYL